MKNIIFNGRVFSKAKIHAVRLIFILTINLFAQNLFALDFQSLGAALPKSQNNNNDLELVGKIIDFRLQSLDGSGLVSNKNFLGKKTILIFFDIASPSCMENLIVLRNKNTELVYINFAIIDLSARQDESKALLLNSKLDPRIEILSSPINSLAFLKKFGNKHGAMPFLVLLDENGNFCQSKNEMFNKAEIRNCNAFLR